MKQAASDHTIPIPSKLRVLHDDSHIISKIAPKIRIIHIFSPKIVNTDEAHFREIVQSLTGQHASYKGSSSSSTGNISQCQPKASRAPHTPRKTAQIKDSNHNHFGLWNESNIRIVTPLSIKDTVSISDMIQAKGGIPLSQYDAKVKKEFIRETYKGTTENSNNGLLTMSTSFSDMDGLFQDPSEFPSPFSKYSQINIFGEMPWSLS